MKKYLIQASHVANGILYLTVEPQHQDSRLSFQPGQYATIGFRGANSRRTPLRCFSITSSKYVNVLQFAIRLGGDFTQALAELGIGEEVFIQGPYGQFTASNEYDKQIVMIAGGIGITPFMSMLRSITEAGNKIPITLLYSYRVAQTVPFLDELRKLEQQIPQLTVVLFATDQTGQPLLPRVINGRIEQAHIKHVTEQNYSGSTYFICGPKSFAQTTEKLLLSFGILSDRIVTESFTQSSEMTLGGYNLRKITYGFASALLVGGVISIAFLDLSRYVPKHTASANSSQTTASQATTGSTSTDTVKLTGDNTNTPASTTISSSPSQATTPSYSYQQPVTQQS